jgi:hypothetical protein
LQIRFSPQIQQLSQKNFQERIDFANFGPQSEELMKLLRNLYDWLAIAFTVPPIGGFLAIK